VTWALLYQHQYQTGSLGIFVHIAPSNQANCNHSEILPKLLEGGTMTARQLDFSLLLKKI
jgi:hypothetical protein